MLGKTEPMFDGRVPDRLLFVRKIILIPEVLMNISIVSEPLKTI